MAIATPAYLVWRDGRPRWEPGPGVRRLGFRGRNLKDAGGAWLSLAGAIEAATDLNAAVAEFRRTGSRPVRRPQSTRTVADLHHRWLESPRFKRLAASTRRDYLGKARVFVDEFGGEHVAALQHHDLYQWWERMYQARGHAMANGVIAVARTILSYAPKIGWRQDNPARNLGLLTVPPRVVVWTPSEIAAVVATGDRLGLSTAVDAILLALYTGQRQGDVLDLKLPKVADGRARFEQSKRKARVTVPFTDQLAIRLAAIRQRRAALPNVVNLADAAHVLLTDDGRRYDRNMLRRDFDLIRSAVAVQHPEFQHKQFMDLRDTAITRLALAGCSIPEIRAITGHSLETVHQVLKHYIAIDDRMATAAIDKLKAYMTEEGIAV